MRTVSVPTHGQIKKAIRSMPWGKEVWFYSTGSKSICSGKLIGFKTTIYENYPVIESWRVQHSCDSYDVEADYLFTSKKEAIERSFVHLKNQLVNKREVKK